MKRTAFTVLKTVFGDFDLAIFTDEKKREHVALSMGDLQNGGPVLTRLHSECITGEVFSSLHCDCRDQLHAAMKAIGENGRGLIIYLRQEGRDIGLTNKIKAYELQRQGMNTIEANIALGFPPDARNYGVAAEILRELGVTKIRVMTNNPDKINQLDDLQVEVVERVPLEIPPNGFDDDYLRVKKNQMGHLLDLV